MEIPQSSSKPNRRPVPRLFVLLTLALLISMPLMGDTCSGGTTGGSSQEQRDANNQAKYNQREDARRATDQAEYKAKVDTEHANRGW